MNNKWTSRKFWMSVIVGISGLVTVFWGAQASSDVATITGAILTVFVTLGYVTAEAKVDAASVNANAYIQLETVRNPAKRVYTKKEE